MTEKPLVLTHTVQSGNARLQVELRIEEDELTISAVASVDIGFCIRVLGKRNCIEVTHTFRTLLRIRRGEHCTAYLDKDGHSIEIPIEDVLSVLQQADVLLLWPEAEEAIREFLSKC